MTAQIPGVSLQQLQHATYEIPLPFDIQLNDQSIGCERLLRVVPGKRMVFLGRFVNELVIIKLFIHPSRAKVHWSRELNGAILLREKHILTPSVVASGVTGEGILVLVFRYINGQDLASLWKNSSDADRERRATSMMTVLSQHHASGLTHHDLHYGNFLVADGEQIYTLDPEEVKSHSAPLKKKRRLKNLALFLAQTFDLRKDSILSLLTHYAQVSAIELDRHDPKHFWRWITHYHQQRIDQYLKKILRECTEVIHKETQTGYTLCRRENHDVQIQRMLEQPELFFESADSEYLKQGNTCTVKSIEISGRRYVMKRYNPKGVMYELAHKGKMSRARRSWINAHLLRFVGISTPEPVALVENQPALGKRCSYFISRQVQGQSSWDFFCGRGSSDEKKCRVADELLCTLKQLREHRLSHGDMKGSNFLVGGDKVWVLDLDALVRHKQTRTFKASWKRDKKRFLQNWDNKACYEPWKQYFNQHLLDADAG